jgi:hypothetical protein
MCRPIEEDPMTEYARPDEAAEALAQVRGRQEQVINVTAIPTWYWWLVGGLTVILAAAVDRADPVTVGSGVSVFVLGMLAGTGWAVRGALHVKPHNDLVGPPVVLLILGFVALVVGLTLAVTFGLRAGGVPYPATLGAIVGAVLLVSGGPPLGRLLRRIMLRNRGGGSR